MIAKSPSGYSVDKHVVFADDALSTADGLSFTFSLSEDTPPGTYSVCYCSGQEDDSLEDLGDGDTTYVLEEDKRCVGAGMVDAAASPVEIMELPLFEHSCMLKCSAGCVGPSCYCDGYNQGLTLPSVSADLESAFCLPKHLCAEACDEDETCVGIGVHDDLPLCFLYTDCASSVEELDRQYFEKKQGTACTQFSDFSEKAGAIAVTNRVHVGVDYIATPGEPTSIELTGLLGMSLLPEADGMLSADRIMVIDCGGTCGIAGPSASVEAPNATVDSWSTFWPKTYFREMASEDAENPVDPTRVVNPIPAADTKTYTEIYDSFYCNG